MLNDVFLYVRFIAIFSVALYFVFDHFESKRIKDEREEFIRLKTFELMQKLNMWALTVLSLIFVFLPQMPALAPLMILVATSLYGEVLGKLFYRRKF